MDHDIKERWQEISVENRKQRSPTWLAPEMLQFTVNVNTLNIKGHKNR